MPSDSESINTDSDFDDDNIFVPSTSSNKIEIYTDSNSDVESISKPSFSSKKLWKAHRSDDEDPVPTVLPKSPTPDVESSDYDSEDNVPLAQLQKKKPIIWKKVASPVVPMPFKEPDGPSILDNSEAIYMPLKPIKRGYKVWVRADINGYVNEFQIYTGKIDNLKTKAGLGERVIRDLTIFYCRFVVRPELESLSIDQVDDLLAEMPSDTESINTDSDFDDDNIFVPSTSLNKIEIYTDSDSDVESVSKPSFSSKKLWKAHCSDDEDPVPTVLPKSPTPDVESSDYDSEDNVPLAQLQKKKPIVWKKVAFPVVPMPFEEPNGPSILVNVEYPHFIYGRYSR
ncbi:hypothetical protein ILUMI_00073 [Ignelater luminosus]|uniref:Uncharacterized protein n=1 Tax=Ignelater luminosus TaxID=2038154 RepID=A0A8K0GLL7_IGNLU|nr:hypothetical protein ILUMI_00073 [Ignelater luminosus]